MSEKLRYEKPVMEVVRFASEDIVRTSGDFGEGGGQDDFLVDASVPYTWTTEEAPFEVDAKPQTNEGLKA